MSMPKGKHQGGQTQGFSPRFTHPSFVSRSSAPQQRPDVSFHVAATPFPPQQGGGAAPPGGPQLRGLHLPHHGGNPSLPPSHQQQPPPPSQSQHSGGPPGPAPTSTPPGSADMGKQGPPHLQGQPQMPQGQMPLNFGGPNQARPNQSQPYFTGPRGPTPRMPNHRGQVVNMPTNNVGPQLFSPHVSLPQMQMYSVQTQLNPNLFGPPSQIQMVPTAHSRSQAGGASYFPHSGGQQPIMMTQQQLYHGFHQSAPQTGFPVYYPGMQNSAMAGGSGVGGPGLAGSASQPVVMTRGQSQMGQTAQVSMMPIGGSNVIVPGLTGEPGTPSGPVSSSSSSTGSKQTRRKHALDIVDPVTMKNVDIYESSGSSTPPRSGDSSARETPQPSSASGEINYAAEFAARVAKVASEDSSESSGAQAQYSKSSVGSPQQVVNINGPDHISMNSIAQSSEVVLSQSDTSVSKPPIVGLEDTISSSWKQTQSKASSIGNKTNSHSKVETSLGKTEDQGPVTLEAETIVNQELERDRPSLGVKSVNAKEVSISQAELTMAPSLGQPVFPMVVTNVKEHSSGVLAVESNLTPVVSAITNSPDIELVHHRPSNRDQYQGVKSSTPAAHASPRRKQKIAEAAPSEKVATTQSQPAVTSLPAVSPVTQGAAAPGISLLSSMEPKPQREHTPPASAIVETKLPSAPPAKKSSPAPEPPVSVEENVFVAPAPKEKSSRGRDRSSHGKEAEKPREKSQGRDRDKSSLSRSRETTPLAPPAPVAREPTPPVEPPPQTRPAAKPTAGPPLEEPAPKHQANGETGDTFEGKSSQQRSKGKRAQLKKELNRKGAEKEGTEMDAFAEAPVPAAQAAPAVVPPVVPPAAAAATTAAAAAAAPFADAPAAPVTAAPAVPAPSPALSPVHTAVPAAPAPALAAPAAAPVAAPAVVPAAPTANHKVVDSVEAKTEELEADKEEEKLVAARNEENVKVSAAATNATPTPAPAPAPEKTVEAVAAAPKPAPSPAPAAKPAAREDERPARPPEPQSKKYERDFLIGLKNAPLSKVKPENLPDLEVVLKDPRPSRSIDITRGPHDQLIPKYVSNLGPGSRGGVPPKRGSQQGKAKGKPQGVIHVSLSLKEEVKLRETENAWKPGRMKPVDLPEEDAKTEELYKKVRGVLNRLTPQKFQTLVQQVQSLPIDNSDRLQGVINLVFDKAIDEPSFSVAYAQMCRVLSSMQVPAEKKDEKAPVEYVNFRKLIVNRCQQEFEKNTEAELNKEERLKEIANCKDPEKKKELQLQYEEEARKIRMKSVGNIRFIGELFKLQMLTTNIMHRCIRQLLVDGEEESLECLCKLLTTIGKDLEQKNQQDLSSYFDKMKQISHKRGEISSRVRFMLQDVIELRQHKWVPRRDEVAPKTIDQIQKEAEKETLEQAMNSGPPGPRRNDDRGDRRKNRGAGEDGWSTAGRYRNNNPVDTTRLKQKIVEVDNLSLGSRSNYTNWNANSKAADISKKGAGPLYSNNSFAALQDMPTSEEKRVPTLSSGRPSGNKLAPSPSIEKERMLAGFKTATEAELRPQHAQKSRSSSRDNAPRGRNDEGHAAPNVRLPSTAPSVEDSNRGVSPDVSPLVSDVPAMPENQVRVKTMVLIDEYFNNNNESESAQAVAETFGEANIKAFAYQCLNSVLEKSSQARQNVGKLMCHLIKEYVVPKSVFCACFSEVVSEGDDLAIDIPKIWLYLAEIIVPLLSGEIISFSEFRNLANNVPKLVAEVLQLLVKDKGPQWIRERWDASGVSWTDFVEPAKVDSFVKQHKLEFTLGAGSPSQSPATSLQMDEVQKKLLQFLKPEQGSAHSFDEICDWIGANVGERVTEPQFIRALMTALCESAVSQSSKLKEEVLAQHSRFFQKYIDNKEKLELQCLYAVQALVNRLEHPQGLLCSIFHCLWENDFISRESFNAWESSVDSSEQHGKGVALKSLTTFFTALREGEDESEES